MALDLNNIMVLNYNHSVFCVDSSKEHYVFNASDGVNPTINIMPLSDVQYINSNTRVFKDGWLTFEEEYKEEIYKQLRIFDWEDILTDSAIEDILRKPTMNGLQKIIDITNSTYFDRVRLILLNLIENNVDIKYSTKDVIDRRYKELSMKQRKTSIELTPKVEKVKTDKTAELEQKNNDLQAQLDEMKKVMEQMIASQKQTETENNENSETKKNTVKETVKATTSSNKKSVGRPSSKKS